MNNHVRLRGRTEYGFSMIELLIVVAIIAIIAGIALPQLLGAREKAWRAACDDNYKALSGERSPGFDTILKVLRALGLKLHAEPTRRIAAPKSKRPRPFNRSAA